MPTSESTPLSFHKITLFKHARFLYIKSLHYLPIYHHARRERDFTKENKQIQHNNEKLRNLKFKFDPL